MTKEGKLPKEIIEAEEAWEKAEEEAYRAWLKTRRAWKKAEEKAYRAWLKTRRAWKKAEEAKDE